MEFGKKINPKTKALLLFWLYLLILASISNAKAQQRLRAERIDSRLTPVAVPEKNRLNSKNFSQVTLAQQPLELHATRQHNANHKPRTPDAIYLSASPPENTTQPTHQIAFDCSARVHAVYVFNQKLEARPSIVMNWVSPNGDIKTTTTRTFYIKQGQRHIFWAGIDMPKPRARDLFNFFNPSEGVEYLIGEWSVKAHIDKHSFTTPFKIYC